MASQHDKPDNQERGKKGRGAKIGRVAERIYHYSGAKFVWRKFIPPKDSKALPTGVIWLIGIYVAFFGVASQRYENRIDIIENRANSIYAQLAVPDSDSVPPNKSNEYSVRKKALSRIARVQNMTCPYKPNILNPHSVFISLFRDSKYQEMVKQLKETAEDWKGSLDSVNLQDADLKGANLRGADLGGAKELTVQLQLCEARTLYTTKVDKELKPLIKETCPELLERPK